MCPRLSPPNSSHTALWTNVCCQSKRDKVHDKPAASVELLKAAPSTGLSSAQALQAAPLIPEQAGLICAPQVSHTGSSFREDSHRRKRAGDRAPPASEAELHLQVVLCL